MVRMGEAHPLGFGEVAGVQGVAKQLILFLDHAGAGARPAGDFFQFNPQPLADHAGRRVKLGRATLGNAARKESVLHWLLLVFCIDGQYERDC